MNNMAILFYLIMCFILFLCSIRSARKDGDVNIGEFLLAFAASFIPLINMFWFVLLLKESKFFDIVIIKGTR